MAPHLLMIRIVLMSLLFSFGVAHAHRQPEMVSKVEYVTSDDGTTLAQITHRIHAHDALKIISLWTDVTSPDLDDQDQLDRLGKALMVSLQLSSKGTLLGEELDGNYLYVYVEASGHPDLLGATGLSMIDHHWTHRVDLIEKDGTLLSHTFSEQRGTKVSASTKAAIP